MKAVFLGLGYIGLPTAIIAAREGIEVVGVDIDPVKVEKINSNNLNISEEKLDSTLEEVLTNKSFKAQTNPEKADVFFIVVPTPIKENNEPDLSLVESAIVSLAPFLEKGNLVIIESTVSLGTTNYMVNVIYEKRPDLIDDLYIAYCPERVLPGNIIYELENNDRVIGGINDESTEKAYNFYKRFVKGGLHRTDSKTAELCKLTENSYRDVQIAFANELSIISDKSGVNVWELINLANKHPRINILKPGSGVGGHCIAVDPWFLISNFPQEAKLIREAREGNNFKAEWCINKALKEIDDFYKLNNYYPTISCMGITYKPDADDTRESPSRYIAIELIKKTKCKVLVCDPNLEKDSFLELSHSSQAYAESNIVLWLVGHKEFYFIQEDNNKKEIDFCGLRSKT